MMKKVKKFCSQFLVLAMIILAAGCQSEKYEVLTEENEPEFSEGSEFRGYVERSAMYDGSSDDEIDESPCFSIEFPFSITVNGLGLNVRSAAELASTLELLNGAANFSLVFPLTIKTATYNKVTINNEQEFEQAQQNCSRDVENDMAPITCLEPKFPVRILAYDMNIQETFATSISSKQELYTYLQNSRDDEILSFDYPIQLFFNGSNQLEVNSNTEFLTALKTCN